LFTFTEKPKLVSDETPTKESVTQQDDDVSQEESDNFNISQEEGTIYFYKNIK